MNIFGDLKLVLAGGWIGAIPLALLPMITSKIYPKKSGGDASLSWYNKTQMIFFAWGTSVLYYGLIVLSFFLPLQFGTSWFLVGVIMFVTGFILYFLTFRIFNISTETIVTGGTYKFSRNPMYVFNILALAGIGVVTASLLFIIILVLFSILVHFAILAEEKHLGEAYGSNYLEFKSSKPRYFLFFLL